MECLNISPLASYRKDLFDVLPVRGSPQVDELIRWFFEYCPFKDPIPTLKVPKTHVTSTMWMRVWKTATSNAVNFHLPLAEGASKRAIISGGERGSEYFFHKGEAVRIIREGLQGGMEDMTELFIIAIAHLISIAIIEGEPAAADMHMSAMLRIMAGRGGLSTFADVPWRVIVWNDLRLAATQLRKSALPYCPRVVYKKLPPSLLQQARLLTLSTLPKLPTSMRGGGLHCLWSKRHHLSLSFSQAWVSQIHRGAIQDLLYRIEYQLCSLTSKACGEYPIAPVVDALHLPAHTFAWTAIHHSPVTGKVQAKLLRQLHRVISETNDLISTWMREASLEALLWVCFVGSVGAFMKRAGKDSWAAQLALPLFLDTTRIVVSEMRLTEIAEYKRVLKDFPWTDFFCVDYCRYIWDTLRLEPPDIIIKR